MKGRKHSIAIGRGMSGDARLDNRKGHLKVGCDTDIFVAFKVCYDTDLVAGLC